MYSMFLGDMDGQTQNNFEHLKGERGDYFVHRVCFLGISVHFSFL